MDPLHKKFANEYLKTGNGTQSVLAVDPEITTPESAAVKASRLLRNDKVRDYLESKAELAAVRMQELMEQADNLGVAYNATKDILDRAGYKPVEKAEIKQEITDSSLTEEEKESLKKLIKNERAIIS